MKAWFLYLVGFHVQQEVDIAAEIFKIFFQIKVVYQLTQNACFWGKQEKGQVVENSWNWNRRIGFK